MMEQGSAVISQIQPPVEPMFDRRESTDNKEGMLFPNPANKYLNYKVYSEANLTPISIKVFDLLGREIGEIYSGTLQKGYNTIENISISNLPKSMLLLQVTIGNKISNHKILI